mgnify:CR=1 FL=1
MIINCHRQNLLGEKIVESRMEAGSIGFGAKIVDKNHSDLTALLKQVMPQDLTKFGLIPESHTSYPS